jgi:hypothetical protein
VRAREYLGYGTDSGVCRIPVVLVIVLAPSLLPSPVRAVLSVAAAVVASPLLLEMLSLILDEFVPHASVPHASVPHAFVLRAFVVLFLLGAAFLLEPLLDGAFRHAAAAERRTLRHDSVYLNVPHGATGEANVQAHFASFVWQHLVVPALPVAFPHTQLLLFLPKVAGVLAVELC